MHSPQSLLIKYNPGNTLVSAQWNPVQTSDLHNYQAINMCCLKPRSHGNWLQLPEETNAVIITSSHDLSAQPSSLSPFNCLPRQTCPTSLQDGHCSSRHLTASQLQSHGRVTNRHHLPLSGSTEMRDEGFLSNCRDPWLCGGENSTCLYTVAVK